MVKRYGLRDDQRKRIEHLLPDRKQTVGVTAKDNRLFVEAVLYRYRAGIPWRDLPERFGDWNNIARRHRRWSESGVWERVFTYLAEDADNEYAMLNKLQKQFKKERVFQLKILSTRGIKQPATSIQKVENLSFSII